MTQEWLPLPGTPVEELDTPSIVIDLDAAESNIRRMQEFANENGVSVRPHTKTNKSPYWAWKQMNAGAIGICCAKVGEAEQMAAAGIPEIMIPNQIVTERKIRRLMSVASTTKTIVAVDSEANVSDLSEAASSFGVELGVIIEINVGMDRCGVEPDAASALSQAVVKAPGLRFDGLMGYEGHTVSIRDFEERKTEAGRAIDRLLTAASMVRKAGVPVNIVSAAGSGTYNITGKIDGITELQAGSYIFMDGDYLEVFNDFEPAMTVLATVISKTGERAVLDCGLKSVSVDRGLPYAVSVEGLKVNSLSEEHTKVSLSGDAKSLRVGDKVSLRAMHGDTTINIHDYYFCVRDGRLETVAPIVGRGKFR
ncbi:MAG: DSD1 family PLP-dependent enzyme [Chloroflexi bacterium]|nr:DSD1 family PLP-dependent enzyme [Chloroflexota bacterium]MDA1297201.1 DSD1 family PLP-dependent enzyme [Chloroflexota bacterium]